MAFALSPSKTSPRQQPLLCFARKIEEISNVNTRHFGHTIKRLQPIPSIVPRWNLRILNHTGHGNKYKHEPKK